MPDHVRIGDPVIYGGRRCRIVANNFNGTYQLEVEIKPEDVTPDDECRVGRIAGEKYRAVYADEFERVPLVGHCRRCSAAIEEGQPHYRFSLNVAYCEKCGDLQNQPRFYL